MKTKKGILLLTLALAVMLTLIQTDVYATGIVPESLSGTSAKAMIGTESYPSVAEALAVANASATDTTIVLCADTTETATLLISNESQKITLDLAGHTLTGPGGSDDVICVDDRCAFILKDSIGTGKVVQPAGSYGNVVYVRDGLNSDENSRTTFIMDSGRLENLGVYSFWACVRVIGYGVFTMSGGSIYSSSCVGVTFSGSKFEMTGGTITSDGNTGVQVNDGVFNFRGGSIEKCHSQNEGAGMLVNNSAKALIAGGSIVDCETTEEFSDGGGIFIAGKGEVLMTSGRIYACAASGEESNGGGVYVSSTADCAFQMTGGSITYCQSEGKGGGIYIAGGSSAAMNGGVVTDCLSKGEGGGVYVYPKASLSVKGQTVIRNNKKGTAENNVYLYSYATSYAVITLDGDLEETASIGVSQNDITDVTEDMTVKFGTNTKAGTANYAGANRFFFDGNPKIVGYTKDFTGELVWEMPKVVQDTVSLVKYLSVNDALHSGAVSLKLLEDFAEPTKISVNGGTEDAPIILDLNGYTLTGSGKNSCISVNNGYFILRDSGTAGTGRITMPENSTFSGNGGAVYVTTASFMMEGGTITGCKAQNGGGVYLDKSQFYMTGGEISGNTVSYTGGGLFMTDSTAYFSGSATIDGNLRGTDDNNVFAETVYQAGNLTGRIGINNVKVYDTISAETVGSIMPANAKYTGTDSFFMDGDHSYVGHIRREAGHTNEIVLTKDCTVSFQMNGHGTAPQSQTVWFGLNATRPAEDPSAAGYYFEGWFTDSNFTAAWDFTSEKVYEDRTVYAKWSTLVAAPQAAENLVYDGSEKTGVPGGTGYTLSGTEAALDAGEYAAVASLASGYRWADGSTGSITYNWSIGKADLSNASIADIEDVKYTGAAITPTPAVTFSDTLLTVGTDFSYSYSDNFECGKNAQVTVTGNANYKGTVSRNFRIYKETVITVDASQSVLAVELPECKNAVIRLKLTDTTEELLPVAGQKLGLFKESTELGNATTDLQGSVSFTVPASSLSQGENTLTVRFSETDGYQESFLEVSVSLKKAAEEKNTEKQSEAEETETETQSEAEETEPQSETEEKETETQSEAEETEKQSETAEETETQSEETEEPGTEKTSKWLWWLLLIPVAGIIGIIFAVKRKKKA